MATLSDGLARLIEPWTMEVPVGEGKRLQHFPPLVDMLRAMVAPSSGRTVGGANDPSARSVINVQALDLLEHIQDVTRAWLREWRVQVAGELGLDLRGFWDRLHMLHRTGVLDQDTFEHLAAYPDVWAARIWDQVEPPLTRTLRGSECPKCGVGKVTSGEGESADNLTVTYRRGQEVTAECRAAGCGGIWVGRSGLIELGRALGVELDMTALEEMADTPE